MATEFDLVHGRCRSKVCVVCYEKALCMLSDLDFPHGICTGCTIALSKKRKDVGFEILVLEPYDLERKVGLQLVGTCLCRICTVAKGTGLSVLQLLQKKNISVVNQHQSLFLVI